MKIFAFLIFFLSYANCIMTTLTEQKFCVSKKFYTNETALILYDISDESNRIKTTLITDTMDILYESFELKNKQKIKINETRIVNFCFEKSKGDKTENKVSFAFYYINEEDLKAANSPDFESVGKNFNKLYFAINEIENNLKVEVEQKDGQLKSGKDFNELINKISMVKILIVIAVSSLQFVIILAFFAGSEFKKLKFDI